MWTSGLGWSPQKVVIFEGIPWNPLKLPLIHLNSGLGSIIIWLDGMFMLDDVSN